MNDGNIGVKIHTWIWVSILFVNAVLERFYKKNGLDQSADPLCDTEIRLSLIICHFVQEKNSYPPKMAGYLEIISSFFIHWATTCTVQVVTQWIKNEEIISKFEHVSVQFYINRQKRSLDLGFGKCSSSIFSSCFQSIWGSYKGSSLYFARPMSMKNGM